jgi:ubiquinone biosynthesis protein COQ9
MTDLAELERMRQTEITQIREGELANAVVIRMDTSLPIAERIRDYLAQIKNPYCFLCGKTPVQVSFREDGKDLDRAVFSYLQTLNRR